MTFSFLRASFLLESLPLTLMTAGHPTSHIYLVRLNVERLNVEPPRPRLNVELHRLDTHLPPLAV